MAEYGTLHNPGVARNIPHPLMFDVAQGIKRNPLLDFFMGGIADWMDTTAQGYPASIGQSVMAGLEIPLTAGAGKLAQKGLKAIDEFIPDINLFHAGRPWKDGKFDLNMVGTGEGWITPQGRGMYASDDIKLADQYMPTKGESSWKDNNIMHVLTGNPANIMPGGIWNDAQKAKWNPRLDQAREFATEMGLPHKTWMDGKPRDLMSQMRDYTHDPKTYKNELEIIRKSLVEAGIDGRTQQLPSALEYVIYNPNIFKEINK